MSQPIHILTELGILKSFSVAKKITEKEIKNFFKIHRKKGLTDEAISKLLQENIVQEIKEALETQKIPGLNVPVKFNGKQTKNLKQLATINEFIAQTTKDLKKKKYDKMTLCHFINSVVNIMGLTEHDFEEFHKKNPNNVLDENDEEPIG